MWHTTFVGAADLYAHADRRVRFVGRGDGIHLSDFAIVGKLNYRDDHEANDGVVGTFGEGSTLARLWIEHTKTGLWIVNSSHLIVDGCRFRNTVADGANLCVGVRDSVLQNCTARGTGDDCFAFWPATYLAQKFAPGGNVLRHCTGQLPFLANGAAIYGGEGNAIEDCLFSDVPAEMRRPDQHHVPDRGCRAEYRQQFCRDDRREKLRPGPLRRVRSCTVLVRRPTDLSGSSRHLGPTLEPPEH